MRTLQHMKESSLFYPQISTNYKGKCLKELSRSLSKETYKKFVKTRMQLCFYKLSIAVFNSALMAPRFPP